MTTAFERRTACVTAREISILNFYRASELQGGLILAAVARRVRDAALTGKLLTHSAEEIGHARMWTETIAAVGGELSRHAETYQARYARGLGAPASVLQVLVLTQVFERRVYQHFLEHARRPDTHVVVRATLERMLDEEKGHLSWVADWLRDRPTTQRERVRGWLRQYAALDARIYAELTNEFEWRRSA